MASAKTLPLARERALREGFFNVADPGASGTLDFILSDLAIFLVVTEAAESRALPASGAHPVNSRIVVVFKTDGGDLTITGADQSVVLRDAGDIVEFVVTDVNGTLGWRVVADSRAQSASFGSKTENVPIGNNFRTWDAVITNLPSTASNDDMGLVTGTFLTDAPTLNATEATPTNGIYKAAFEYVVPQEYKAGTNLTLDIAVTETAAGDTVTLDAEVANLTDDAAADICATDAQDAVGGGTESFTITGTDVEPGDVLFIVLTFDLTADTETPDYSITNVNVDYNAG